MLPIIAAAALAAAGLLAAPARVVAQGGSPLDTDRPRVERIRFEGVASIPERLLRDAIVTEETRCRGLLLRPLCAITDWRLIHERHYLDREELPLDVLRLRVYYFQRGWRRAAVSSELRPDGEGVQVLFRVAEGPPTLVESLAVRQTREVLTAEQVERADFPQPGEPLDLYRLSAGLLRVTGRLAELGYLDATADDAASFSADTLRARLAVVIDPGARSTVADLDIEGNVDVDDRTIRDALRLQDGRVLRSRDLVASQRSLYESNLFHEARVEVPEQADSAKRVSIRVREAPPRAGRVGGGFNTMEFIQTEARFTHYNWLGRGRRLDVRGTLGNLLADQLNNRFIFRDVLSEEGTAVQRDPFLEPTWLVSAELMQPAFRSAANIVGISGFAHRRSVPGVAIDRAYGGELSMTRRLDYRAPVSLIYRYEQTVVEAGDLYFCVLYGVCEFSTIAALRERNGLSPLSLSFFADQGNHPVAPTEGHRLRLDLEHASGFTLSDFRYNRVSGEATRYQPLDVHRRRVLAGRIRGGWVDPLEGTLTALGLEGSAAEPVLHPRKRFYAGGSRSVRGFRENQLGPRILTIDPMILREADEACGDAELAAGACDPTGVDVDDFVPRPTGGRGVIEGSVEVRFPLWREFVGAVFVDGAVIGDRPTALFTEGVRAVTPGFGVRSGSPVGPIRVDLGIRPRFREDLPVLTEYVTADGERRLVRLEDRRIYDPLHEPGGIVSQVLRRLTLHLSIGEAY